MWIKICGLTNEIDAATARDMGADALGFVMGGVVLPPEIEPHAQQVRSTVRRLGTKAKPILVTHLHTAEEILALATYTEVSGIQISEPLETAQLQAVRTAFKGEIIKTVAVRGEASFDELRRVEPYCSSILLDSCVAGYTGGTGIPSDWELCARLVTAATKPVWLAGGLIPETVATAAAITKPSGVDVSTGVSCFNPPAFARKDRKDPTRIARFIAAARGETL